MSGGPRRADSGEREAGRFEGRRVLITGASSGIGRATALAFAAAGARVVAAARRSDRLAEVKRDAPEGRIETLIADVSSHAGSRRMVVEAIDLLGGLDVLVNNAGVSYTEAFLEATEERWNETLETNLAGPFFASQVAARHMVDRGGGAIVNVASIDAFVAESPSVHYMASKAGLVLLTRCIAFELGHLGVRCNAVCPGLTRTEMTAADLTPEFWNSYMRRIPMRRPAEPHEQAAVVLFLCSEEASYINGEAIVVDGGQLSGFWYYSDQEPPVPAFKSNFGQ
jgi:NAD(P)-dependent dehydrogenase (short-subunit alcohol dehydrogenase family)